MYLAFLASGELLVVDLNSSKELREQFLYQLPTKWDF